MGCGCDGWVGFGVGNGSSTSPSAPSVVVGLGVGVDTSVGTIVGLGTGVGVTVVTVDVGSCVASKTPVSSPPPLLAAATPTIRTMNAVPPRIGPFHHHDRAQKRRQPSRYCRINETTPLPVTVGAF